VKGVAQQRVLVVDESAAIRETIRTVLGGQYEVCTLPPRDYLTEPARWQREADLLIIGAEFAGTVEPQSLPTIWLTDLRAAATDPRGCTLPREFSPRELRRQVRTILAPPAPVAPQPRLVRRLTEPYVSPEAARVLDTARTNRLPVLIVGEAGTGKRAVARALHEACGAGQFLSRSGATWGADSPLAVGPTDCSSANCGTLYIHHIDRLPEAGQDRLHDLLEPTRSVVIASGLDLRLIAAAERDLDELVDAARFEKSLYYRITVLSVRLPALRERQRDIPALAEALASDLCTALELPAATFTKRALERLSNYRWYGNLMELESVLARTLVMQRPALIDDDHLLFESLPIVPPVTREKKLRTAPDDTRVLSGPALELVANEIAHEFRNPMVTVKTFAQIAEQLVRGKPDHEQLARLTGEAVNQMDAVLENLLRFARCGSPSRQPVPLARIIAGPVDQFADLIESHGARLDRQTPPSVTVLADSDQLDCALSNLFAALARDATAEAQYSLGYSAPATLFLRLPAGEARREGRLASMVSASDASEPPVPLGVAIARFLIENNGGELTVDRTTEPPTATIRFALADTAERKDDSGNGQVSSLDRG
jgi:transcriptional regulator with AAA-type ATPase domain